MRNIPLKKLAELKSQVYDGCHEMPGIEGLLPFEPKILSLKEKQKQEVLLFGFQGACNASNIEAIEAFCAHPTFKIDFNSQIVDMALEQSSSIPALEYILHKAPISIPNENLDLIKCENVISSLYGRLEYHKNYNFEETVFLLNYLVEASGKLEYAQHATLPIFDLFDAAIDSKNNAGLRLLIDKYEVTGEEAGIQFMLKTKSKKVKDNTMTLIASHKEQRQLQKEISLADKTLVKTVHKI